MPQYTVIMEANKDITSNWFSTTVWKGFLVMVTTTKTISRTKTTRACRRTPNWTRKDYIKISTIFLNIMIISQ